MTVRVDRLTWGKTLERLVLKLDPFCGVEAIHKEIDAGRIAAWMVRVDDVSVGCFITRIDQRYDGEKDLALLFTIAEEKAKTAISKVMYELLENIARDNGAKYIRIHVENPALARIVERSGFNFLESVFIKAVNNVNEKQ